jgi:hypothetical protein
MSAHPAARGRADRRSRSSHQIGFQRTESSASPFCLARTLRIALSALNRTNEGALHLAVSIRSRMRVNDPDEFVALGVRETDAAGAA